ncbi:MAG: Rab family GTPase [Promethearchaeota archaeon]
MKQNLFKAVVIGDGAVGKTSITVRICHGQFDGEYLMTIGVEFGMKFCTIKGQKIKMQIWDTAGQERFRFLQPAYYNGAHGALLVYDVTRRQSFENIPIWMGYLVGNIGHNIPTLLVGNKCDLDDLRAVDVDEGEHLANHLSKHYQQDISFFETSAKTNQNVEEVFLKLGTMMLEERLCEVEKAIEWKERAKSDWW